MLHRPLETTGIFGNYDLDRLASPRVCYRHPRIGFEVGFVLTVVRRIVLIMRNSRLCPRAIGLAAGLILGATLLAQAQGPAMDGKTAEQAYKNIKVLVGTPPTNSTRPCTSSRARRE